MIELKQKRNLNSKHFDLLKGEKVKVLAIKEYYTNPENPLEVKVIYEKDYLGNDVIEEKTVEYDGQYRNMGAHLGHIHYFNKLGFGDGEKCYREIDLTLIFDDIKRGWAFQYHSYNPFIPEYSDGWAEFRDLFEDKDQIVKYRAICQNKVKGELIEVDDTNPFFDDNINNNGVLYKNAFGEDRDYLLYNTRSSLVKVATINNPNNQTEDAIFEWEIDLPDKDVFRVEKPIDAEEMTEKETKTNTEDGVLVGYKLDLTKNKEFNTPKQTLIGSSKLDGKEWFTYLKGYKAWDSNGNVIFIEAKLYTNDDGKRILRKIIPIEFLQNAVGRVFTDTTTSYYAGAGDGRVYNENSSTWSTVREATSGQGVGYTDSNAVSPTTGQTSSSNKSVIRAFLPVDTSGIPDTATISSANLYFAANAVYESVSDTNAFVGLVQTTQTSTSSLVVGDFSKCGSLNSATLGASTIALSGLSANTYYSFSLNSTGLGWISKTGYTKLGMREGHDLNDDDAYTAASTRDGLRLYYSENTGTTYDPYLSVTYSTATTVTKTIQAKAAVKQTGVSRTVQSKARLEKTIDQTIETKASIKKSDIERTIQAKAMITIANGNFIQAKAAIRKVDISRIIQAKASIEKENEKNIQSKARIEKTLEKTTSAKAAIFKTLIKSIQAKAKIDNAVVKTIQAKAALLDVTSQTIESKARIENLLVKSISAKAMIRDEDAGFIDLRSHEQEWPLSLNDDRVL